jgi:hypothetical protein
MLKIEHDWLTRVPGQALTYRFVLRLAVSLNIRLNSGRRLAASGLLLASNG